LELSTWQATTGEALYVEVGVIYRSAGGGLSGYAVRDSTGWCDVATVRCFVWNEVKVPDWQATTMPAVAWQNGGASSRHFEQVAPADDGYCREESKRSQPEALVVPHWENFIHRHLREETGAFPSRKLPGMFVDRIFS